MSRGYQIQNRGFLETVIMRIGLAIVVFMTLPTSGQMSELSAQPKPSGLARVFDLTFLSNPTIYEAGCWVTLVCLLLFISGLVVPISLGFVTMFHILVLTLYNSQGSQTHSNQIVSLVLLAQWVVYLWGWGFGKKAGVERKRLPDLAFHYSLQAIAAVYVIAGVIKLLRTKGMWAWKSPDIAVELLKTNAQKYYEYLEIDPAYEHRTKVASWMIENPWLTRIFLGSGLLIELLAFLALYNRTAGLIGGVFLLLLHFGIELTMGLDFENNSAIIWIFLINIPFWLLWLGGKLQGLGSGTSDLQRNPDYPWQKR